MATTTETATKQRTEWIAEVRQHDQTFTIAARNPAALAQLLSQQTGAGNVITRVFERPETTYAKREQPTPEQWAALQRYADAHGRTWKRQLNEDWFHGRDVTSDDPQSYLLRQVRNQFGPSWLVDAKLPDVGPSPVPADRYTIRSEQDEWVVFDSARQPVVVRGRRRDAVEFVHSVGGVVVREAR